MFLLRGSGMSFAGDILLTLSRQYTFASFEEQHLHMPKYVLEGEQRPEIWACCAVKHSSLLCGYGYRYRRRKR